MSNHHDTEAALNEWLATHPTRGNEWLKLDGLEIYVRRTQRLLGPECEKVEVLDLATITATKPGEGALTRFLPVVERVCSERGLTIYVENILVPRLAAFFELRGYMAEDGRTLPCYFKRP